MKFSDIQKIMAIIQEKFKIDDSWDMKESDFAMCLYFEKNGIYVDFDFGIGKFFWGEIPNKSDTDGEAVKEYEVSMFELLELGEWPDEIGNVAKSFRQI